MTPAQAQVIWNMWRWARSLRVRHFGHPAAVRAELYWLLRWCSVPFPVALTVQWGR